MTVENQTIQKRVQSDGVTDVIPFSFKVQSVDDFSLYLILRSTGVPVLLTGGGVDYSVELEDEDEDGGSVTLTSVATEDYDYLLFNDMDITQPADFPTEGTLSETSVERAFDRACLINLVQQNSLNRALKLKIEDPLNVTDFGGLYIKAESTATRQGKVLAWNSTGDEIETSLSISELEELVELGTETATAAATAAALSAEEAEASAEAAAGYAASYTATSTTTNTIATSTKIFTIAKGKLFTSGQDLKITAASDTSKFMHGTVQTLVEGLTTATLTMNITSTSTLGGSFSNWNIAVSGVRGATGATGAPGAGTGDMLAANKLSELTAVATDARTNIEAAKSGVNDDITALTNLTDPFAAMSYLKGLISGYVPSNISGSSTTAAVDISAGSAIDSTGAKCLAAGASSWAVSNGNNANGYSGGTTLPNSSTIHFYKIQKEDGTTANFASTSLTPTLPTDYVYYRRIFSIRTTAAGALIPYVAHEVSGGGLAVQLNTPVLDQYVSNLGTTRTLYQLSVPSGLNVQPLFRASSPINTGSWRIILTSPDATDVAPSPLDGTVYGSFKTAPGFDLVPTDNTYAYQMNTNGLLLITNTSNQIAARSSLANSYLAIATYGWIDFRR